jgi:hypothetical protein
MTYRLSRTMVHICLIAALALGSGCAINRPHQPQSSGDGSSNSAENYPERDHARSGLFYGILGFVLGYAIAD